MKLLAVKQIVRVRGNLNNVIVNNELLYEVDESTFNDLSAIARKDCEVILDCVDTESSGILSAKLLNPVSDSFCNDAFVHMSKGDNLFVCLKQLSRLIANDTGIKLNEAMQDKLKDFFKK